MLNLLLNKESTVGDALGELARIAPIPDPSPATSAAETAVAAVNGATSMAIEPTAERPRRLRMMELFNHRIYKVFQEHEEIDSINDQYWTIRAEEIPPEELDAGPEDKLIHVRHFYRDQRMCVLARR